MILLFFFSYFLFPLNSMTHLLILKFFLTKKARSISQLKFIFDIICIQGHHRNSTFNLIKQESKKVWFSSFSLCLVIESIQYIRTYGNIKTIYRIVHNVVWKLSVTG